MDLAYYLILLIALIAASPWVLFKIAFDADFRRELFERIGNFKSLPNTRGCLWIHASSVGEVGIAKTLIKALKVISDSPPVVLSTFTPHGYQLAQEANLCPVFRLPPDVPFWIHPLFRKLKPKALVLVEAELWPCLLRKCWVTRTPVLLVNGRLSERSFKSYATFKCVFHWLCEGITRFSMRSETDARRLIELGVSESKVKITGNIKFDASISFDSTVKLHPSDAQVVAFGSTRPGDEEPALNAMARLLKVFPDLKFVLAPRHVNRCPEVESLIQQSGLSYKRYSEYVPGEDLPTLLLLDRLGMLNALYAHSCFAYVGGGLSAEFGGQNIIEPALHSQPVIFGNHMANFEEEAKVLVESGGGLQIESPDQLYPVILNLLQNPEDRKRRGDQARQAVLDHQGALQKNLDLITETI